MGSVGIFMSPLVSLIGRSTVDTENLSDRMNRADTDKNIATISTSATQLSGTISTYRSSCANNCSTVASLLDYERRKQHIAIDTWCSASKRD